MNKTALITGASSGIGKELATIHAENNGNLILVARRQDKLMALQNQLIQQYGVKVHCITQDLSTTEGAQKVYQAVESLGLAVDYLINNAGFGLLGKFDELPWNRQQQMINLNITALTALTYLFLPKMIKRNSGRVLNVSSTASFMPGPMQVVYFASKSYVSFLSNAIAEELSGTNITVTTLLPGATATEFGKTSGMDKTSLFNKTASARSVAEDGYNAMLKGKLEIVSGLTFSQNIMRFFIPFIPKSILLKQIHRMQKV